MHPGVSTEMMACDLESQKCVIFTCLQTTQTNNEAPYFTYRVSHYHKAAVMTSELISWQKSSLRYQERVVEGHRKERNNFHRSNQFIVEKQSHSSPTVEGKRKKHKKENIKNLLLNQQYYQQIATYEPYVSFLSNGVTSCYHRNIIGLTSQLAYSGIVDSFLGLK